MAPIWWVEANRALSRQVKNSSPPSRRAFLFLTRERCGLGSPLLQMLVEHRTRQGLDALMEISEGVEQHTANGVGVWVPRVVTPPPCVQMPPSRFHEGAQRHPLFPIILMTMNVGIMTA